MSGADIRPTANRPTAHFLGAQCETSLRLHDRPKLHTEITRDFRKINQEITV